MAIFDSILIEGQQADEYKRKKFMNQYGEYLDREGKDQADGRAVKNKIDRYQDLSNNPEKATDRDIKNMNATLRGIQKVGRELDRREGEEKRRLASRSNVAIRAADRHERRHHESCGIFESVQMI